MRKHTAIIMIGAMGSGKTTVAKLLAQQFGLHYINPDDYWERGEPYSWERACENWAHAVAQQYKCVKTGISYVLDTSSRVQRVRQEACRVVKAWSHGKPVDDFRVVGFFVDADLNTCLRRNKRRKESQPDDKVVEYYELLESNPPRQVEDGFDLLIKVSNDDDESIGLIKDVISDLTDKGVL